MMDYARFMQPILTGFQNIKPPFEKSQTELNHWLTECHIRAEQTKSANGERLSTLFSRYAISEKRISKRAFECGDIQTLDGWANNSIYRITPESPGGLGLRERIQFFSERADLILQSFYETAPAPQHLVHVTCTGYMAPNAAQKIVSRKQWPTQITNAYHMGCYAALPAIRMAAAFMQAATADNVDIVHNEMCGLHLNPLDHSPEQIIVQSLFADGHIKYSVVAEIKKSERGLRLLNLQEKIIPDSIADMTWFPTGWGMQMSLSREVPDKIQPALRDFIKTLLPGNSAELLRTAIFAIHPGGPKIIEAVQKSLELSDEQCAESKKILFERGNMSSATLPHIWQEILNGNSSPGKKIVSLAFGPGLTLFGAVFEVV